MPMFAQNAITPSSHAEPVSRYVSQPIATCCSHVPIIDRPWPIKNKRKLRCLSARNVRGSETAIHSDSAGYADQPMQEIGVAAQALAVRAMNDAASIENDRSARER